MGKIRRSPEQIVRILREIEVSAVNGVSVRSACREHQITEQTYYRWRREYGGLKADQAKRLKSLEKENMRLKRLVADQALDISILKEVSRGNF